MSPRGAQALYRATQALAVVEGRDYVTPDDVKRLVVPVFAHRVAVNRASRRSRSAAPKPPKNPAGDPDAGGRSPVSSEQNENCNCRPAHGRQDNSVHDPDRRA